MIEKTISDIEAKIRDAQAINPPRKEELLRLLGQLKTEMHALSRTHAREAEAITQLTQAATDPQARGQSAGDLRSAVEKFEQSHPRLVQVVNRITQTLSDLGI